MRDCVNGRIEVTLVFRRRHCESSGVTKSVLLPLHSAVVGPVITVGKTHIKEEE